MEILRWIYGFKDELQRNLGVVGKSTQSLVLFRNRGLRVTEDYELVGLGSLDQ